MKLFLASEAKHPESIEKLRRFIGGFEGKTIAYIPTAANGEVITVVDSKVEVLGEERILRG